MPVKIDPNNANRTIAPSLLIEMAIKIQKNGMVVYCNGQLDFSALFLEVRSFFVCLFF